MEAARIEQLESQLLRLQAQADRLAVEHESVTQQQGGAALDSLLQREARGRGSRRRALESPAGALLADAQQLRDRQQQQRTTARGAAFAA